jgi:hypothetical protein
MSFFASATTMEALSSIFFWTAACGAGAVAAGSAAPAAPARKTAARMAAPAVRVLFSFMSGFLLVVLSSRRSTTVRAKIDYATIGRALKVPGGGA